MSIESLIGEHREIEAVLDDLAMSVGSGSIDREAFHRAHRLCVLHYEREEALLALPEKIRAQHAEVLELAACLEEDSSDAMYLVRRFLAMARHNMIEEERDVFPFV